MENNENKIKLEHAKKELLKQEQTVKKLNEVNIKVTENSILDETPFIVGEKFVYYNTVYDSKDNFKTFEITKIILDIEKDNYRIFINDKHLFTVSKVFSRKSATLSNYYLFSYKDFLKEVDITIRYYVDRKNEVNKTITKLRHQKSRFTKIYKYED